MMAMDIRLDFIKNISPEEIDKMTHIRAKFIELDNELKRIANEINDLAGLRAVSIARTHVETACMYSIKSLCILGEMV